MKITLDIPDRVWWAASRGAEDRGTDLPAVIYSTVLAEATEGESRIARARIRRDIVITLARQGMTDAAICERMGETRHYVSTVRQAAGIAANRQKRSAA